MFSSHAGAPTDRPLYDNEDDLYEIQKAQKPVLPLIQSVSVETTVSTEGRRVNVRK